MAGSTRLCPKLLTPISSYKALCHIYAHCGFGMVSFQGVLGDGELEDPEDGTMMSQRTVDWITSGLSVGDKSNSWAGPEHWKYRKPRGKDSFLRCCF